MAKGLDPALVQATLEQALGETAGFEPLQSRRSFQIHMSDIGEAREVLPPEPGKAARQDYEYVRHGTRALLAVLISPPVKLWLKSLVIGSRRHFSDFWTN